MTRDKAVIEAALAQKGFRLDNGDHNYYIYYNLAGKKTAKKTKTSHGSGYKSIGDPLLGQMAKQVGLTKPNFLQLVDCTLDQKGYEKIAFSTTNVQTPASSATAPPPKKKKAKMKANKKT